MSRLTTSLLLLPLALLVFGVLPLYAQDDGRIIFTDPKSKGEQLRGSEALEPRAHSWGMDLMIGNDGFGLGTFYGLSFEDTYTLTATLSLSEIKDSRQVDYYTYWGDSYSMNKINRVFRVPLFAGVQYRLFKDDIVENFRPYVGAGAGPVLLYITSAEREFFSSLSHGAARFTFGGYLGAGAHFGFDRTSLLGLNVRYYIVPLPSGVQSVAEGPLPNGNGFFISVNFGFTF